MGVVRSQTYAGGSQVPGVGGFNPRGNRLVAMSANIDVSNIASLDARMPLHMHTALVVRMGAVATRIVERTKAKLRRIPEGVVTPVPGEIFGYDTGRMHDTLTAHLVDLTERSIVAYDLESDQAEYWPFVEFGHMLRNGRWWPGYHMLGSTIIEMEPQIRQAVRQAWSDAGIMLAGEARVAMATMRARARVGL